MEKREIRQQVFALRKEKDGQWPVSKSEKICDTIIGMKEFQDAASIYAYMDCKGEAAMGKILETAWAMGKKTAVPKVLGMDMKFYLIQGYGDVAPGYFQVPEPVTGVEAEDEQALLIVPGVAFDKECHRCGYGKGFYDRYLANHTGHVTIGAAFDYQIFEKIPYGSHDKKPQMVVTESTVYRRQL